MAPWLALDGMVVDAYGVVLDGAPDERSRRQMQKWQYKIIVRETKKLLKDEGRLDAMSEALDGLGDQGWELVNFAPFSRTQGMDLGGSTQAFTFVFKRPAQQGEV